MLKEFSGNGLGEDGKEKSGLVTLFHNLVTMLSTFDSMTSKFPKLPWSSSRLERPMSSTEPASPYWLSMIVVSCRRLLSRFFSLFSSLSGTSILASIGSGSAFDPLRGR